MARERRPADRGRTVRAPTIHDVARAAAVSITTVSRVTRDHPDVRQATRDRVKAAIADLGYPPSPIARARVRGRSQMLALLVSDIANPFYPELAKSIEREAAAHGYVVVVCGTDDKPAESMHRVRRLLDHGVDGIIHASVAADEEAVVALVDDPRRVVFTNRRPSAADGSFVAADNFAGATALTQHLLELGHRRIGFVAGPSYASNSRERLDGFLAAVGREPGATALVAAGDFSPESGARAVDEWLAAGEAPTAVIGVNDVVAVGALDALLAAGRVVPRDVSLAGFDDIPLASSRILGLTTVAQHIDVMGKRAAEVMIQRLGQPEGSPPVQEVLEPERIVRATTGAAR